MSSPIEIEQCPDCNHGKIKGHACLVCDGMARSGELSARHQGQWALLEFSQEAPVARKAVREALALHQRQLIERVQMIDGAHSRFRRALAAGVALPWPEVDG